MKKINSKEGRTMTEIILVMVLLILFSISTLTLVATGSDSYINIINNNENNSNLRVAQSYIHTKVRQNLDKNAIYITTFPESKGNCLVIKDGYSDVEYETVIFLHEGEIKESIIIQGGSFNPEASFTIVEVDKLNFKLVDGKKLSFETSIFENGQTKKLKSYISLINN
ncbi:MAG: DUF4860 domain-containing protein [Eubacteriales bacterium]